VMATATAVTPAADAIIFGRAFIQAKDFTTGSPWSASIICSSRTDGYEERLRQPNRNAAKKDWGQIPMWLSEYPGTCATAWSMNSS